MFTFLSNKTNDKTIELKQKSLDDNMSSNKETVIISKKFGKNIKATLKVGAHHYKCCKSKLNNSMYVLTLYHNFNPFRYLSNCLCKR